MSNIPTLPSAKPPQTPTLILLALSTAMTVAGVGLGSIAISLYFERAGNRLSTAESITRAEQDAEIRQREAQLKRGYDAPVWLNEAVYDPGAQYQVDGTRKIEVPVIVGTQLDTAICVGTMGPDGFVQNPDNPLCLGF